MSSFSCAACFQVFDTRYFHKFGERSVYRERTQHFATFTSLQERGLSTDPSVYSDADAALPVLELSSGEHILSVTMHATKNIRTCTCPACNSRNMYQENMHAVGDLHQCHSRVRICEVLVSKSVCPPSLYGYYEKACLRTIEFIMFGDLCRAER